MPKFLSNVEHDADIIDINGNSGTSGQVLSSLGPGNGVDWIDQTGGTSGVLSINVKNISGGTLTAGTAVSVATPSSNPPAGIVVEVIAADYDNINDMPAIGILKEDLNDDAEGEAVMMGSVSSINTNSFNVSDELYVGANGALVNSKPTTAGQLIQKIAVVVKKHSSNGVIKVLGAGRSNDVPLPLYIDNANQRVGISEPSPTEKLVVSETRTGSTASDAYTTVVKSVQSSGASPNPGTGGLKVQYTSSSSNVHAFGLVAGSSSSDFLTTGPMHFYTNSDLDTVSATGFAMQLDTSQRLTIGSMTASQKLNVAGNVTANRYYGNTSTQYYLDPNDVTTSAVLSGDVAIGDFATPAHRLVVRTPGGESGNTEDGVFIKSPFAGGSPVTTDAQPFLSIGCRSASGGVSRIFMGKNATATSQESLISYSSDNDVLSIYKKQMGTYTEHVRFGNSGSTSTARTRFYGNVGIGTDPSAPLHVSGVSRATEGFSTDGNNKFYTWRALQNTGSSSNQYYRIARVTGSQSTRFIIELAGRSTSYTDGVLPAFGKIVGQLNNDNNFDIVYYNASATDEVVDEVGQVDVNTVQTDIYVRVGQYAELTATAHISDGAIVTYDSNSGSTSAPTNYVQATEYKLWNTGNGGSGSGLDADLLDGNHASAFASSSHTHAAGDITSGTFSTARIAHNSFDIGDTTAETGRSVHETGIYTFNRNNGNLGTGTNTSYYSVLAYGQGAGGSAQIATEWTNGGNKLYFRSLRDTVDNWWSWKEIYHTGNDGSGSGLDADLLDGVQGANYFKKGADIGGSQNLNNYTTDGYYHQNSNSNATSGSNYPIAAAGMLSVVSDGAMVYQTYHQYNGNAYYHRSYYNGSWYAWRKVWQDGNDGSGSGLDADLLDGVQGGGYLRSDAADTFTGKLSVGDTDIRRAGIYGLYDSYRIGHIWSMGTGFNIANNGADFGNLYGLAYKHTNNTTGGTMGGSHQMVWCNNGSARGSIGNNAVWHAESMKAPIFYDSNNTAYYLDPNNTSFLKNVNVHGTFRFQRSATTQTGQDDNVTVTLGDSDITFTHNNDDDGDASRYNFKYTSGGSAVDIFNFDKNFANFTTPYVRCTNNSTDYAQLESNSSGGVLKAVSNGATNVLFRSYGDSYTLNDFGVGVSAPAYKLDVDGTIRATGDVIAYSDVRVKENIKTIDNALDKVKNLRGVEYNKIDSTEKNIGVVAQEVEKILPEVVKEDEEGMKSVAYGNITAVLIEAIKEQQKQIDELKSIINGSS